METPEHWSNITHFIFIKYFSLEHHLFNALQPNAPYFKTCILIPEHWIFLVCYLQFHKLHTVDGH